MSLKYQYQGVLAGNIVTWQTDVPDPSGASGPTGVSAVVQVNDPGEFGGNQVAFSGGGLAAPFIPVSVVLGAGVSGATGGDALTITAQSVLAVTGGGMSGPTVPQTVILGTGLSGATGAGGLTLTAASVVDWDGDGIDVVQPTHIRLQENVGWNSSWNSETSTLTITRPIPNLEIEDGTGTSQLTYLESLQFDTGDIIRSGGTGVGRITRPRVAAVVSQNLSSDLGGLIASQETTVAATVTAPEYTIRNTDGIDLSGVGLLVLVTNQSDSTKNGVYEVQAYEGSTRLVQVSGANVLGNAVTVTGGNFFKDSVWICASQDGLGGYHWESATGPTVGVNVQVEPVTGATALWLPIAYPLEEQDELDYGEVLIVDVKAIWTQGTDEQVYVETVGRYTLFAALDPIAFGGPGESDTANRFRLVDGAIEVLSGNASTDDNTYKYSLSIETHKVHNPGTNVS